MDNEEKVSVIIDNVDSFKFIDIIENYYQYYRLFERLFIIISASSIKDRKQELVNKFYNNLPGC